MSLPEIATREEWIAARTQLLEREKELTRARDALIADRRRLADGSRWKWGAPTRCAAPSLISPTRLGGAPPG